MAALIHRSDNRNGPIITEKTGVLSLTYFNLIHLSRGEEHQAAVDGFETVYVVLSGRCDVEVNGGSFLNIGKRPDLWSGKADSVYATTGAIVRVHANQDGTEIAVAGGRVIGSSPRFEFPPKRWT